MWEVAAIFVAGIWAGGINVVVGSGTLVTFPTLLFFGYPPLVANVSNNVGLVAGGISGSFGYRHELSGNQTILRRMVPTVLAGALTGALLLLVLPDRVFGAAVPVLIALGLVMVVAGPSIQRRAASRDDQPRADRVGPILHAGMFLAGAYGGYFGAAQGVIQIGLMSMFLAIGLQELNAIKNVLTTLVNALAAATFMVFAWDTIDWSVVATIAAGAFIGGYLGARIGRRLPRNVLRAVIIVIGVLAIVRLVFFD
jgi:uncharacterized membrane protein YfcA